MVYWMNKDCRRKNGKVFYRVLISDLKLWLPVIKEDTKVERSDSICKHDRETEAKNGGYVCMDCFHFMSYAVRKRDNKTGKQFSDIS